MRNKLLERISNSKVKAQEITSDILLLDLGEVNAYLIGDPFADRKDFALVDAGFENSYDLIVAAVERRFGDDTKPNSIILTHGHFDNLGSAISLSEKWDIPVFVHQLELPYITGQKDYQMTDPNKSFPHNSLDINHRVSVLPADGSIPDMPGWKWIHTPGHTEGHICLFREMDRTLIAGDSVLIQEDEFPHDLITEDLMAARDSLLSLKALNPYIIAPSHGKPLRGREAAETLDNLINNIYKI